MVSLRKVIFWISILCALGCVGYLFYSLVFLSWKNDSVNNQIRDVAFIQKDETEEPDEPKKEAPSIDWNKLKSINSEIVAWVKIDGTNIDYPVLYHEGDDENSQYYLYKDYNKDYSEYGSVFIDYRSGIDSKNIILHGHHMIDGSMFSDLTKYGGTSPDIGFYQKAHRIKFYKPEGDEEYEIISVMKTPQDNSNGDFFNYLIGNFSSNRDFINYMYDVRVRSMINCPIASNENDDLLTLSTCSYEYSGTIRTVVVARKIRDGEQILDVSSASENTEVLHAKGFYSEYGGTRPKESTFEEDFDKIKWYDGNINFSYKEP